MFIIHSIPCHTHVQSSKMSKMFIFMLLLLSLIVTIDEGEETGYKHEPSLFIRTCCNSSNLGQTIYMREGRVKTMIFCPDVKLQACPPLGK